MVDRLVSPDEWARKAGRQMIASADSSVMNHRHDISRPQRVIDTYTHEGVKKTITAAVREARLYQAEQIRTKLKELWSVEHNHGPDERIGDGSPNAIAACIALVEALAAEMGGDNG